MIGANVCRHSIPRRLKAMLPRPHLTGRLHGGVGDGLVVVQAPAGFGKTALVAEFASELDFKVCWLSLDGSSSSPDVFARQLVGAFTGEELPAAPATSEKLDDLRAYVSTAAGQIAESSAQPLLLVIDNTHELRDADESSELLAWLLDTLPEAAEAVLSGREMPRITTLDKRMAMGDCLVLGPSDLAFSVDEVRQLIADRKIDAAQLHTATSGWPAAVRAVIAGTVKLDEPGHQGEAWTQYLATEVWQGVPPAIREHLLALAIPPAVDSDAGEALVGRPAWDETARWLDTHDFLCDHLGDCGRRLNTLFRQFILLEAERLDYEAHSRRAARVAADLEAGGDLAAAVEVARDARLAEELRSLIERHGRTLIHAGQFALLKRAFGGVSAADLDESPLLRAFKARVLAHTGRPAEALGEVDAVLGADDATLAARVHALLARHRALRLLGRTGETEALFAEIEALGPTGDASLSAELDYHKAQWVLQFESDLTTGERLLRKCLLLCAEAGLSTLELVAASTLGQILVMRGDAPAAVNQLTTAARGWRALGRTSNLGWVLNNLGMAHVSAGDFDDAVGTLEEAILEAQRCENQRNLAYATASLAEARLGLGMLDEARRHFEEAIRICSEDVPDETLASLSIAGLAQCLLAQGDLQQADYFAERAVLIAETVGAPFEEALCLVTQAAIDSAALNHSRAISGFHRAIALLSDKSADSSLRLAHYRLALAHFRANERNEAVEVLGKLVPLLSAPWMYGSLLPAVREHPMFAQWTQSRGLLGPEFGGLVQRQRQAALLKTDQAATGLPKVSVRSLGRLQVSVDGRPVADEDWQSSKSKEMFFLFLAHRDGVRKEQAVEALYPELEFGKCNSAFHSNLYRVRKALYPASVVKRDGAYLLNPEGEFDWDAERFQDLLRRAGDLPAGSDDRARLHAEALELYRGPFAEAFYSEWSDSFRRRLEERAQSALALLAGYYAGRADFEAAAECMQKLLERDRANEEAAWQAAVYRSRAGQSAAALSFLDDFSRLLERDYGVPASARIRTLRSSIAAGQAV
jgi:LuxR family transcriptional regulator, maltose regulon positive regulatory protein